MWALSRFVDRGARVALVEGVQVAQGCHGFRTQNVRYEVYGGAMTNSDDDP